MNKLPQHSITDLAWWVRILMVGCLTCSAAVSAPAAPAAFDPANRSTIRWGHTRVHPTRLIAKYKAGKQGKAPHGFMVRKRLSAELVLIDGGLGELTAVAAEPKDQANQLEKRRRALHRAGLFEYVEPDYQVHADLAPMDAAFIQGDLWGLSNTGQQSGQAGMDIGAEAAWDVTTGSQRVVVAVIDSGIRYTHHDLKTQMWINPREIPGNQVDDDGDGYVDNVYGINAITGSGDPHDDFGHGTHVAGTIGAAPNDGNAHVGVAWQVQLMACKFLGADGFGTISDAIECIDFAVANGARILNNSWGGAPWSQALYEAIDHARRHGVLFVASAGNDGRDTDQYPHYPSGFELENIISVAALDRNGRLFSLSNRGLATVHLGAPGVAIYSAGNRSDTDYWVQSGTSTAAPHVSGSAALLLAHQPAISLAELRQRLLTTTIPIADLSGRCLSGGGLRVDQALRAISDGALELNLSLSPPRLVAGTQVQVFVMVTDLAPVTNATVQGRIKGGEELAFRDDGVGVDSDFQDGSYAAQLSVPDRMGVMEVQIEVSAPGYQSQTLTRQFSIANAVPNDAFAAPTILVGTQTDSSNVGASKEVGEPDHAGDTGGRSVWWTWTALQNCLVRLETAGSDFDTLLAVYSGASLADTTLIAANDDAGPGLTSSALIFPAIKGTEYRIAVDGFGGAEGNIALQLTIFDAVRLLPPRRMADGTFLLQIGKADGASVEMSRVPQIEVCVSSDLSTPGSAWTPLLEPVVLVNGLLQINDRLSGWQASRFYRLDVRDRVA